MTTNETTAEDRLARLGIHLPDAPTPFGAYVPAVQTGNLLFLSGMLATSGHTATVVGMTAAFWMWRRRLALPFGIFAVAVGWSRIAMNSHHLSDVVAAAIWGVLIGPWMFILVEPRLKGWAQWWPSLAKVSRPDHRPTEPASPPA